MLKKPFFLLCITLFCLYHLLVEPLFVAVAVILLWEILSDHQNFRCRLFPGSEIYIYFLSAGLFIGIIHFFFIEYTARNILKHIVYMLFPLLFWMLGKNINVDFDSKEEWKTCITGLFAAGLFVSFYDLLYSLYKILAYMNSDMTLYGFRSMIGAGHPLTLVTLFIYIYLPENITFRKKQAYCSIGILTVDLLIHFSRMNLLNFVIFFLFSGRMKKSIKFFRYGTLLAAGIGTLYAVFPSVFNNFVDRFKNTLREISYARTVWDHASIVTNWRGYEAYCEIGKFRNAGIFEKILGGGFGAQLDVNGKAYLVTTEEMLPFLHNGYFSVLMIWGILGCVLFAVMLFFLYIGDPGLKGREQNFWRALVVITAVDTLFVHGPFFSPGAACLFLYLGILDSKGQRGMGSK